LNVFSQAGYKTGTLFYHFHTIAKNETLGEIAIAYKVPIKDIIEVNATISDPGKIVEGQRIKVPDYSRFIDKYPNEQWSFVLYRVKQGDRLKNIAKDFKTEVDYIKATNPGIDTKPTVGSEIRVPVRKQGVASKVEPEKKDTKKDENTNTKTNPAISFNWGNNESPTKKEEEDRKFDCSTYQYKQGTMFNISVVTPLKNNDGSIDANGLAFVQGALIAANEMKDNGLQVSLNIVDVRNINSALQSQELKESNIIIAPTSVADLNKLSNFSKENKIPLIAPSESRALSLASSNPYFIQAYPTDEVIYNKLTSEKYENSVYPIIIKSEKPDSVMLGNYRNALKSRYGNYKEHTHTVIGAKNSNISSIFDDEKENLVFVCSNDEPFIQNVLDHLKIQNTKITVYGRERWLDFGIIDRTLYFRLNLHIVKPFFVDYTNTQVKEFIQLYRAAYNSEPNTNAFLGYDVFYYSSAVLKKYGTDFIGCLPNHISSLLNAQYKFKQNGINEGFVNEGCFMIKYTSDFDIKRE